MARAGDAAPGFELDDRNARSVAELCVSLDGMPLALELAAARMASMSPRAARGRLDERWSVLGGGHGREPRHRNLLDVVQWSYELLGPDEQRLFDHLSVFAGGFELDAV
jgi:non-specific serine/threonine protein kinase